jgi:hypothetical protein
MRAAGSLRGVRPVVLRAMRSSSAPGPAAAVRLASTVVLGVTLFGLAGLMYLIVSGLALVQRQYLFNVFFRLYALQERDFLLLLAAFAAIVWWCAPRAVALPRALSDWLTQLAPRITAGRLACAVFCVTAAGTWLVMHGLALSMDEYAASFQARLFAAGKIAAPIPAAWQGLAPWMTPTFITYKPEAHLWVAGYLPVYAAIRALFLLVHLEWLTNPALAAVSVLLLDRVARRLWPGEIFRRNLALVYLVTSTQFLVTSMSGYSMPAHLCLNLLWLLLYLRDDRVGYLIAPLVGVMALGLHNPFPHALFVAPFLLRLLMRRRWATVAYMGAVYLAGAVLWLRWLQFTSTGSSAAVSAQGLLGSFRLPGATMWFTHGLDLALVFTWQTPVLAIMLVLALLVWRTLRVPERDLAAGLVLTFAFYLLFPQNQGHGWGYRYIYGALGNAALLGAVGTGVAAKWMRRDTVHTMVAISVAATLVIQLPLRLRQTERFVRPYATANAFIASRPAPLIAVDFAQGWYSWDLVRNDPLFGEGPRVIAFIAGRLPPPAVVPPAVRDSVYVLSRADMERFGITLLPPGGK